MDQTNIFQQAVLIQLATSCWGGVKTLKQGVLENLGNSQWLRGRKYLINPELLATIKATMHKARNAIQLHALPFPMIGLHLVPKDSIPEIDDELDYLKEEFQVKVDTFLTHYEGAREEARIALGELFNEADYPMDIRSRFRFDWRFLLIDVPHKASILSPEIYEREKAKFQSLMEETRELTFAALRTEFGELITGMVDKLSGDGKARTFRWDMTRKLNEFLDTFGERNLFDDARLAELVDQARDVLGGMDTPYALTYNEVLRTRFKQDMSRLKASIDQAIEELPRRKIMLAEVDQLAA